MILAATFLIGVSFQALAEWTPKPPIILGGVRPGYVRKIRPNKSPSERVIYRRVEVEVRP